MSAPGARRSRTRPHGSGPCGGRVQPPVRAQVATRSRVVPTRAATSAVGSRVPSHSSRAAATTAAPAPIEIPAERVRAAGWAVVNADVAVVAERHKVGPHRAAMRERLAGALGLTGVAGAATGVAKILFFVFLILFVVSLVAGRRAVP